MPRPYAGSELICFDRLKGSRQAFLDMGYAELGPYPFCLGCKTDVERCKMLWWCCDVWVGMAYTRSGRADFGCPNHPVQPLWLCESLGLFWVASAWFTLRLYILCTLLEASSVDENPLFEQVQDITKVVVRPRCTWAFFQVVNPHSHGPMKVGPHGTWDHMRTLIFFAWMVRWHWQPPPSWRCTASNCTYRPWKRDGNVQNLKGDQWCTSRLWY